MHTTPCRSAWKWYASENAYTEQHNPLLVMTVLLLNQAQSSRQSYVSTSKERFAFQQIAQTCGPGQEFKDQLSQPAIVPPATAPRNILKTCLCPLLLLQHQTHLSHHSNK